MVHVTLMLLALSGLSSTSHAQQTSQSQPDPVRPTTDDRLHIQPLEPVQRSGAALVGPGQLGLGLAETLSWPVEVSLPELMVVAGAGGLALAMLPFDERVYAQLQRMRWTFERHSVFNYTLLLGDGTVDLLLCSAFSVGDAKARRTTLEGVEALAGTALTAELLKHILRVTRPEDTVGRKRYFQRFRLVDHVNDAMPSGHTMSAFATATVISANYPEAAPYAFTAASLVGLSVIERGWHWPSDVIAGAALGYALGRASVVVNQKFALGPAPNGTGLSASGVF
jgi:undecaprenyl-diphosphatase